MGSAGQKLYHTGMQLFKTKEELLSSVAASTDFVIGQFGNGHMPYEYDGLGELPHLSDMAAIALVFLVKDADDFFLLVEGGRIDHACHDNDLERAITETKEFSDSVQVIKDWAQLRENVLIIVTADHETGDISVTNNGIGNYP